ncbi:hypothetical protein J4205_03005 [Candidatus Pacearchaeota archaeon]|nr:hypothetical protein [Candidatus Pacearchaeota archaeon]
MRVNMDYAYQAMQIVYASQAYRLEMFRRIKQKTRRVEQVEETKGKGLEYQVGRFLDLRA